jgi:hypothetical protein
MRERMCRFAAAAIAVVALVAACAQVAPKLDASIPGAPADFPEAWYRQAEARGDPVLRIDPSASLMVIEVHRAGRLAQLGHDHVVASHDVHGLIAANAMRADLYVPLQQLTVDEASLRREAGFDTVVSDEAIAGTRRNMLGPVLHADSNPYARIAVRGVDENHVLHVAVTVNGVTRTQDVRVEIAQTADGITIRGGTTLLQSDFGITPLSILGGAVQVQDEVSIRFVLQAGRTSAAALLS